METHLIGGIQIGAYHLALGKDSQQRQIMDTGGIIIVPVVVVMIIIEPVVEVIIIIVPVVVVVIIIVPVVVVMIIIVPVVVVI